MKTHENKSLRQVALDMDIDGAADLLHRWLSLTAAGEGNAAIECRRQLGAMGISVWLFDAAAKSREDQARAERR